MIVEVWSDVVCPWCYIGKRRFETALAQYEASSGEKVEIQYMPFMLDPTAPSEAEPVRVTYEKKFGGPAAADKVLNTVTTEAAGEGLDFRMDIALRSNTMSAHRLLVLGQQSGRQAELKERLLSAYFTEGADIGDHETLVGLAQEVGLDAEVARGWLNGEQGTDEVGESLKFAAANGLASVPTYVFDRRVAVPGAQPAEVFARVLKRVAETDGPAQLYPPE